MTQRYHHTSSEIGNILDPSRQSYCKQKNIPVYDRTQKNREHIQQLQEANRQKQQEAEEAANAPRYCLKQFENVHPRVYQAAEAAKSEVTHEFKRRDAGKAISSIQVPKGMEPEPEQQQPRDRYASIRPKVDSTNPSYKPQEKKEPVNYFQKNIKNMRAQEKEMIEARQNVPEPKREKLGEVPEYLQKRKQQWAEEAEKEELRKQLDEELAKIPPGTRPVGDEERKTLLAELRQAYKAEIAKFNSFRIQADNEFQLRAKRECEDKIAQLEKTIREFERPGPLYIAIE